LAGSIPMRGAIDLGALAQARQAQSAANSALANAPSGVVIDVNENDFQQKVIDASNQVPVVVDLWAEWCGPCKQLSPVLEKIAAEFNGKFILAKVDIDKNQNIAAAFQVQSIPAVFAIIAGSAAPLFQGAMPESQVRQVLTEVIRIANEQGVKGTVSQDNQEVEPENKVEEPKTDPKLEAAFNAIEKGNFVEAKSIYQDMLNQNPKDENAIAGLAQVGLLERSASLNESEIRKNASDKRNIDAQLELADLELMKGNPEAGFSVLISAIKITSGQDRDKLRERLLELFVVVGDSDPHVLKARRDLASALF
jgi:putative thioredoxin